MGIQLCNQKWSLQTDRLRIRRAEVCDTDIAALLELWTNPVVMRNVGFPAGLRIDAQKISDQLRRESESEYDGVLMIEKRDTATIIGQCKLGSPDEQGIAHTDIKLLPRFWGNRYGVEIKRALIDYLFEHTTCTAIKATPNVQNAASIKLQEAVGARKTGEGTHEFPPHMKSYTESVHFLEYVVTREVWRTNAPIRTNK